MKPRNMLLLVGLPLGLVVPALKTPDVHAQILTNLHVFNFVDGAMPVAALVQGTDGHFYGTTLLGGAFGSGVVFRISQGGDFTNLASFNGIDGAWPVSVFVQGSDGYLYAMIKQGRGIMPKYGDKIRNATDRWDVVNYVRKLQGLQ